MSWNWFTKRLLFFLSASSPLPTFAWSLWLSELRLNPGRGERAEWASHSGKWNCQSQECPENNAFVGSKFTLYSFGRKKWWQMFHVTQKETFPSYTMYVCVCVCVCVCVLVAQSCLTLCNPMDYSPKDSSVHGISQARILEWVAISFSRGSS